MSNRKTKSKSKKFRGLEGNSESRSSDQEEEIDSDTDEEQAKGNNEEDSFSDASDSSSDSQSSSSSSSGSIKPVGKTKNSGAKALLSDSTDSTDETCEKCAICLQLITTQEVGTPEVCDHLFCSLCIIEWSKNSNVCPLDRLQFSIILVRENKNGNVVKKVPVEEPQLSRVEDVELQQVGETVCEICGSGDRADIMLLCEVCDRGYHTICLTPPIENIPDENEWFCPECEELAANPSVIRFRDFFYFPTRTLRPRAQGLRIQLFNRFRMAVDRLIRTLDMEGPEQIDDSSLSGSNDIIRTSESEPEDNGESDHEDNGESDHEDNGESDHEDNGESDPEDNGESDPEDNGESDHEDNGDSDHEDNGESDHEDNGESDPEDNGESDHEDNGESDHEDNGKSDHEDNGGSDPEVDGESDSEVIGESDPEDNRKSDPEVIGKSDPKVIEDSDPEVDGNQPGTSGLNSLKSKEKSLKTRKTKIRKTSSKNKLSKKRKIRSKRTSKRTTKRKTRGGKRRVKTTRTKKIEVENEDGTITEKIVKTRTYKRRKQKKKKNKLKALCPARRVLRVKSITTPKTVKGRLAQTLGMILPKQPGQFLPDIKVKPNRHMSAIDLNRARAGIPKLHIFGPRDELQYYSSDSEHEEFVGSSSGEVATVAQQRTNISSRFIDRKKAFLTLQSHSLVPKPKPVIEPPKSENVDILGSILDSQAIWHSKNTNVKIKEDGSIEVIKDANIKGSDKITKLDDNKKIDREKKAERMTTKAPMHPGTGSSPGGFRPYNRSTYGESRTEQDNSFAPRTGQSPTGVNFNRFGGPARNDREGYTNYLNNIPQGPTPFCRGGPPLRFRMPARQQLRRIPFPPRNRPTWQPEEEEDEDENGNEKEEKKDKERNEATQMRSQQEEDDDIDLYSDIEINAEKTDTSGAEDGGSTYPALGPPPEPPAFLLGLEENGDFGVSENKDKSEVYDPAEPCDSEEEMVIDEHEETSATPEKKNTEESKAEIETSCAAIKTSVENLEAIETNLQKVYSEDEDEDCPIFSIYSSTSREFSQKEEEERQKEIAEERRKIEELKLNDAQKETVKSLESNETQTFIINKSAGIEKENERTKLTTKKESITEGENNEKEQEIEKDTSDLIQGKSSSTKSESRSRSRSRSIADEKEKDDIRIFSINLDKDTLSKSPISVHEKSHDSESTSPDISNGKCKRSNRKSKDYDSESEHEKISVLTRQNEERRENVDETRKKTDEEKTEKDLESEGEGEAVLLKIATGLEGLDVEEVSSDNGEGDEFADKKSLSSLSLSDLSNASKRTRSSIQSKKKKKTKKRKTSKSKHLNFGKNYEEGEIDDSEKDNRIDESFDISKNDAPENENENSPKIGEKRKRKSSGSGSERQILGSKENKKVTKGKSKDKDLAWKKPSKKDKNYREGKKRSRDRGRSKSGERRKSKSPSPKKDKKKSKERKKKNDKKKEIERYDVRKIVKNKEIRRIDAFGRDIISKSRSISRSRSRTPIRERSRNMLRRDSRSYSRSRSRSFRRGRSLIRRRYVRSRTRSRSKSLRRSYSRSRSRSRSRKTKKKLRSKDRLKVRSRSRGRKTRSLSRGRRRSFSRSRSRSPGPRIMRSKKSGRSRRSWSHNFSRSPSYSPRRTRSITRSPARVRKSYSRSVSSSWSRGRSPLPRTSSLEKLTVVLTTKDKKKWKKKKDGKKGRKDEKKRKKTGNSKEVFASGDNVLVSVNFRNNNNTGNIAINSDSRNTRLNSLSPIPGSEICRKKKKSTEYDTERVSKKSKKSNPISKRVVDVALSNTCPKRTKKLTRLSEKDAEVILNRKPVAVIDLDMSPYREQTPSPVNVVVVSDSGSGDEGKEHTPQRPATRAPGIEVEKLQETIGAQSVNVSPPSSPIENGYIPTSGPKTPPEPQIKFSISKPQQLRQIANPLGDDDDDEEEVDEDEGEQPVESLDRRIELELNSRNELSHKGPNTPPAPRGPSTPKTPPSPQTSPDAYDPFEPTKSRSPSPSQADKENRLSPKADGKDDQGSGTVQSENVIVSNLISENLDKASDVILENHDNKTESVDKGEAIPPIDCSSNIVIPSQTVGPSVSDISVNESPITVVITTSQSKSQPQTTQKPYVPILKQLPMVSSATTVPSTPANLTTSSDIFSLPSPTKVRQNTTSSQAASVTGIQRLQHRLGSPVNRTPGVVKATPEKRSANEIFSSGKYMIRNASKRNGEQPKQPRPLQDATNETIDITIDMDDSPYSPASSEGDDLFDPPPEPVKPAQSNSKPASSYKPVPKISHKSPVKQLSKFDLLFGPSGPTLSPFKFSKKPSTKPPAKGTTAPKIIPKTQKKSSTKKIGAHKMDEDQLRILDELPSSAVELQVKDKFLKKLNRQERVVDEVKTVLKPHYARKHITKEEYKDILRRSVPKICHSRSGEINPSKIQSLIEAYVRKFRHAKKKGISVVSKPKAKKAMFS